MDAKCQLLQCISCVAALQAASDAAYALASSDMTFVPMNARIAQYADFVAAAERLLR